MKFAAIFLGMPKCVGSFWGLKSGLRPSPCSRQKSECPPPGAFQHSALIAINHGKEKLFLK